MAFINIEKCLKDSSFLNNRFVLTSVAAKRANDLALVRDHPMISDSSYTKFPTQALEEISLGLLNAERVEAPKHD
ncbi:DNA-directed RNA polymerase subunit omega [Desulfurispirillum indicum]|uniref:DNA-directed RNA polymerase subunit omega n=1 Tax=Desulfurispirillum indicum (strain ATCC BAA-1389 / DSM 22839 / S5) TaxID=653733 RepID=E6W550_DESIS|nr:DNA-directed RNA polymerase subunit omega [Desulfurispirillum indicum]ADU67129.1 DNA-directed RNA polymerase, omega subunit [Desulfurispirillum indicum S5]UCZ56454.1 DNA-directed RNA polymerase subunit omega [Desulfurispirillum indicum]